jgi:hypothetical protein
MGDIDCKESKTLHWARYDEATQTLEIDFKNGAGQKQSTYRYDGFAPEAWAQFMASSSRGAHFARHIRPRYKGVKIWSAQTGAVPT